jgi:uncharacterized protein (DUF2336 family)
MHQFHPLIDEIEAALASGDAKQRQVTLKRIADYFVAGSRSYAAEQIELFDEIFLKLAADIEVKALAKLSHRLAPLPDAPPRMVRSLAFNDAIDVAAPVLALSQQLSVSDLVANAETKSQAHLLAIAQRAELDEAVTDVLVDRGDRRVVRSVAGNDGARFSDTGFDKLVKRARGDDTLARNLGTRRDIPRHHFLKLVASASAAVRERLVAAMPQESAAIHNTVADIAGEISRDSREASSEHAKVKKHAKLCYSMRKFTEANIHAPARAQDFEKTAVALALYGHYPVDLVERALIDDGSDMVLILAKAASLSRATVKALLVMHAGGRGLSEPDLEHALASFDRLKLKTAKRVLEFYERRRKASEKAAKAVRVVVEAEAKVELAEAV